MTSAGATSAGSAVVQHSAASSAAAKPAAAACYSNTGADSGTGILSTDTDNPAGNSSIGAVDFTVKKKCVIKTVLATGVYAAGAGPADSFTVTFYKNKAGFPGKVVTAQTVSPPDGNPVLNLSIKAVKLKKGKYFASVQASMDYTLKGGWFWETTDSAQNSIDVWENYGGGFGNCTTWGSLSQCFGLNRDFIVTLAK